MNFSEVPPYRHLGNFVDIRYRRLVPALDHLPAGAALSSLPLRCAEEGQAAATTRLMAAIAEFAVRRRSESLAVGVDGVVVLVLLAAIPRNELNDVLVHFFDESVEFRQDTDFLDERLSGNTVFEYSLVSAGPGRDQPIPPILADVSAFADWYRGQPETRHVDGHHRHFPADSIKACTATTRPPTGFPQAAISPR